MLEETLLQHFGHTAFRPGQRQVMEALLAGRSALAVFPTGGGKSLCYQLPALLLDGTTLVISPLIALMKDQVQALQARDIAAARLDSTLSLAESQQVLADLQSGKLKLLYIAPERLINESFLQRLEKTKIAMLAVDEAHCISEWGHNFRPEYLRLAQVAGRLDLKPVLALTATATPDVAADICKAFNIQVADHVQTSFFRQNLALKVSPVSERERLPLLAAKLKNSAMFPAVVYVTLQQTAESVTTFLRKAGIKAGAYHAGLPDQFRTEVQDDFMQGNLDVIVATIAFGMGIDKADVRSVYHYNLPKTLENYQQETGRAGRDGQPAHCEMLACLDDLNVLHNFVYGDTPTPLALKQLVDHLLRQGTEFDISRYDLAHTLDIRPLVLETVLTYLELNEVVQPLGAFYTGYQLQFVQPESRILSGHTPDRQRFLKSLFECGTRGRKWLTLELSVIEASTGEPPERILKALNWLAESGDVLLKPSGLRHRYKLLQPHSHDAAEICQRMQQLFAEREQADSQRLNEVVDLARSPGCLPRHLLNYFGEDLGRNCGMCSSCLEKRTKPREIPLSPEREITTNDVQQIRAVMDEGHAALRAPRQLARFLCGLSSPATSRARLSRHDIFGLLEGVPFQKVLLQAESMLGKGG